MAEIAGGTFLMGDARGERDQKPAHRVTLSTFCLDIKEVTVAEYAACSRCSSPGGVATSRYCNADLESARAHPVNCVTWEQARTYCEVQGKTLPTEAQWEYAARGGAEQRRFPWGKMRPSESNVCWARTYHAPPGTCPVGSFPPEAFGLTDMGGNVREWVADWYGPYPNLELHDPSGPASATERVVRGGGWPMNMESGIVTVYRGKLDPEYREAMLGFRCAGKLRPDV